MDFFWFSVFVFINFDLKLKLVRLRKRSRSKWRSVWIRNLWLKRWGKRSKRTESLRRCWCSIWALAIRTVVPCCRGRPRGSTAPRRPAICTNACTSGRNQRRKSTHSNIKISFFYFVLILVYISIRFIQIYTLFFTILNYDWQIETCS